MKRNAMYSIERQDYMSMEPDVTYRWYENQEEEVIKQDIEAYINHMKQYTGGYICGYRELTLEEIHALVNRECEFDDATNIHLKTIYNW